MITLHFVRRLAAISLLALSLTTFSPAGLNLASAAGEKDTSSKNTGQAAKPDAGGNQGQGNQSNGRSDRAGSSNSDAGGPNCSQTKTCGTGNTGTNNASSGNSENAPGCAYGAGGQSNGVHPPNGGVESQTQTAPGCTKAAPAPNPADQPADKPADSGKDVDSPGCAVGNGQKNGQLATAPGCNKTADADQPKTKADDTTTPAVNQPVVPTTDADAPPAAPTDRPSAVTPAQPITIVVTPTADQPVVATPGQPVNVVVDAAITTPSGQIIPAGSAVIILVGSVPLSGLVEGATISAPNVAAFSAPPFMADVAGVTIQQAPDSQVAATEIPSSLPSTGGGHGKR